MKHRASLLASMDGISRAAFLIARELNQNSRSGLTPRFLSRKLDLPIEEVEYLVDVNHKLLFTDITKIRLAPEGQSAIKRILEGLESHGDVTAFIQRLRTMPVQNVQRIEDRLDLKAGLSKKDLAEQALFHIYRNPDSVLHYVASADFSTRAREVFDILWQAKDGILTIPQIYAQHGGAEHEIEQALWELCQGCACFELFRFDGEERLARAAALLKEIRDYRKSHGTDRAVEGRGLRPVKGPIEEARSVGLGFSDRVCRLTAALAARPVRLRNDGELFREDQRRLEGICPESAEPSLNTCLWAAEGAGWLARVDNTLYAGDIEALIGADRVDRHLRLFEWLARQQPDQTPSRDVATQTFGALTPGAWYRVTDYIAYVRALVDQSDLARLKMMGAHHEYISPSISSRLDTRLARALEETLYWIGAVGRGYVDGDACFQLTPIGEALLLGVHVDALRERYPSRPCAFTVQANYEIVVPLEEMDPMLTLMLDTFAENTGAGAGPAALYRMTREAFVRAMQAGHQADNFIEFLLNHNRGPLPENVLITLTDWRGAAKQVRLRTYHVIESDDPLVIAELEHHRRWRDRLEAVEARKALRYRDMTRQELKAALEKEGYIVR